MRVRTIIKGITAGVIVALPKGFPGLAVIYQTTAFGFTNGLKTASWYMAVIILTSLVLFFKAPSTKRANPTKKPWFSAIAGVLFIGIGNVIIYKTMHHPTQDFSLLVMVDELVRPRGTFSFWGVMIVLGIMIETMLIITIFFLKVHPDLLTEGKTAKTIFFTGVTMGAIMWYVGSGAITRLIVLVGGSPNMVNLNIGVGAVFILAGVIIIFKSVSKYRSKPIR